MYRKPNADPTHLKSFELEIWLLDRILDQKSLCILIRFDDHSAFVMKE